MKLLFITQKLHGQDVFVTHWVREFMAQGFDVTVLCLEKSDQTFDFPVLSMGKERGISKLSQILNFVRIIRQENYDRVFIHMAPVYYALGFWLWKAKKIPTYLWYTHYKMQLGVRLFGLFGTRFFCATAQSLPQYQDSPKKTTVGHGIDLSFWQKRTNECDDPRNLLIVHRLSRSKRVELSIRALTLLDAAHTIDIYGIEAEKEYVQELKALIHELGLETCVTFHGTVPMSELPSIYTQYCLILNMASETIDKTMLEAMTCGCYPVTTARNAKAIGLADAVARHREQDLIAAPATETPEAIADFIKEHGGDTPLSADEMYGIVQAKHSLSALIQKMGGYIRKGE